MNNILAYFGLASSIIGAVANIQHAVNSPAPVTGATLLADVQPAIWAVQAVFPKLVVPMDLAAQIADGAATAINKHFHKGA